MRSRVIKAEFWDDPDLGRMPDGARLLFVGLWSLADREGRLLDSPMMIAGSIWPYRDDGIIDDVRRWLEMLASANYIIRYQTCGHSYIQIRTFKRHQPIHPNERSSRIPPPPQIRDDDGGRHSDASPSSRPRHDNVTTSPVHCQDNSITLSGKRPDNVTRNFTHSHESRDIVTTIPGNWNDNVSVTITSTITSTSAARKLPNTPLPPTDAPPPLKHVEKPVEISPGKAQQTGSAVSPPLTDPRQAISILAERRSMEPRQRRAPPQPRTESELAVAVVGRMLCDWMDGRASALGPPDEALCRRLLEAHGMSPERIGDWLLDLRRRGKHPGSVQGWGWFVALSEAAVAS